MLAMAVNAILFIFLYLMIYSVSSSQSFAPDELAFGHLRIAAAFRDVGDRHLSRRCRWNVSFDRVCLCEKEANRVIGQYAEAIRGHDVTDLQTVRVRENPDERIARVVRQDEGVVVLRRDAPRQDDAAVPPIVGVGKGRDFGDGGGEQGHG